MVALLTAKATGLTKCIAKMKRLQTSLPKRVNQAVTGGAARQELMNIGRTGLLSVVYSAPPGKTYERTDALLESVVVVVPAEDTATLTLDERRSPAVMPPSDVSYGYFFIDWSQSFLNQPGVDHYPARDFQSQWFINAEHFANRSVLAAIRAEIRR